MARNELLIKRMELVDVSIEQLRFFCDDSVDGEWPSTSLAPTEHHQPSLALPRTPLGGPVESRSCTDRLSPGESTREVPSRYPGAGVSTLTTNTCIM
jgi:hypothetical protein